MTREIINWGAGAAVILLLALLFCTGLGAVCAYADEAVLSAQEQAAEATQEEACSAQDGDAAVQDASTVLGLPDAAEIAAAGEDSSQASAASAAGQAADVLSAASYEAREFSADSGQTEALDGWVTIDSSEYYYVNGVMQTGWVVTDTRGDGLQRYWLNSDGPLAKDRLITAEEAGYAAYATQAGYVARGKVTASDGSIYLADNDGRLQGPGWVVTAAYDGEMQRYYISDDFSARTGFFEIDGACYHGNTVTGYVVRGKISYDGSFMLADNDGKLQGPGWVVTAAYDAAMQRYYILDNGTFTARTGFFEIDGAHYHGNTVTGYVVRGKAAYGDGMLLADNDGKLAWEEGWLVTDAYDATMQRYRIDSSCGGYMGAHVGYFTLDGNNYYGREDAGYVVRGLYKSSSGRYYNGDNDGILQSLSGDDELDQIVYTILETKTTLRACFDYVASYPYISGSKYPTGNWSVPFAKEMYNNGGGNCYRYAALFCWLARGLGYDAQAVCGHVPSTSGGLAAHGWVEIYINGATYIFDADMVHAYPSYNWYWMTYSSAPIDYYL